MFKRQRSFLGKLRFLLMAILPFCIVIYWWLCRKKSGKDKLESTIDNSHVSKPSSAKESQQLIVIPKLCFDSEQFATSPDQFRAWFDILFRILPFPIPITAAIMGILVFLGGLLLSLIIDFEREYVYTPAIYIGSFGIAWVLGVLRQASLTVHEAYEDLRPCFLVDDKEYKQIITLWFNRICSNSGNLQASMLFFVLALIVVYIGAFRDDVIQALNIRSLRPLFFFPFYWFTPDNLVFKAAIISYYGFFVALPLGTSFRLMVLNLFLLLHLRHLPVIPAANIIYSRLRVVTELYLFVSGSWFVGVALFGIMLFRTLDLFSALGLGILSLRERPPNHSLESTALRAAAQLGAVGRKHAGRVPSH
jgi:hypothetical protein